MLPEDELRKRSICPLGSNRGRRGQNEARGRASEDKLLTFDNSDDVMMMMMMMMMIMMKMLLLLLLMMIM